MDISSPGGVKSGGHVVRFDCPSKDHPINRGCITEFGFLESEIVQQRSTANPVISGAEMHSSGLVEPGAKVRLSGP